jgi:hypothetical protein
VIRAAGAAISRGELDAGEQQLRAELAQRTEPKDRHFLLTTLAQLSTYRGRPLEAWAWLADAEDSLDALSARERVPFHDVRGRLALELGQIDLAAIDFSVRNRDSQGATAKYHDIALAIACEDFDRAERTARALLAEGHAGIDAGELELYAAGAHWRRDPESPAHRAEARAGLLRAEAVTAQPMVRCYALLLRAQLDLADGDTDAAALSLDRAEAIAESSRAADAGAMLAVLGARIDLARGAPPEALAAHRDGLRAVLQRDLDVWRALPPRPGGVGFLQYSPRRDTIAAAIAIERRLRPDEPAAGFELLLELDAVHTMARRLGAGAATLADVQKSLVPADGVILCVLPAWQGSWAFLVSRTAVETHELRGLDAVPALARTMRATIADTDPATRRRRGEALAADGRAAADRLLPEPLRARIFAAHHVVFVGASLLDGLPLEALPGPAGTWLGAERAISYLPSFATGLFLARRARGTHGLADFSLFAASAPAVRADGPKAEPFDLGDAAASLCRRVEVATAILGEVATLEGFSDLPAATFQCVIGHGVAVDRSRGDDRDTALALAGAAGAALRCSDVEAAGRQAACTLLAVCGGGRGPLRRGDDGSNDLAGAFVYGGAAAIIAAESDLELRPTMVAAEHILEAFGRGASAAEALRAARADALAAEDADPSRALALRVHGVGHVPLAVRMVAVGPAISAAAMVGIAAAVLAAAVFLLRWRRRAT